MAFGAAEIKRGDKGAPVVELQLRLAGFRGTLWDGKFGPGTELQVVWFQRDYMGQKQPSGRVDDGTFDALFQFEKDFPVPLDGLRCPCSRCGGFGQGRFKDEYTGGVRSEQNHRYEYPGMHKAVLHSYRGAAFYLQRAGFPAPIVNSGYRCWINNQEKGRMSTNHMGKAIDLDFPPAPNVDKRDDMQRCDAGRGALVERANFQIGWTASNRKALEPANIAPTWIHLDVATPTDEAAATEVRGYARAARLAANRARARTEKLDVFPFLGFGVDTFSGSEVLNYLNPEDSGDSNTRETMGVSFQYPLFDRDANSDQYKFGIYLYGQTLHGVRSTEINCAYNQPLLLNPACPSSATVPTLNQTAIYLLRSASSLEGVVGVRFEFFRLQHGNAALYLSKQAGFVAVEDDDDDAADVHHIAFGARIREGRFRNSYIEFGEGRNDLFSLNPGSRKKLNARVVSRLVQGDNDGPFRELLTRGFFFAHVTADVDGSNGGDAVQSFIGLAFCPWGSGKCGAD